MNGSYHLVAADRETTQVVIVGIFIDPQRIREQQKKWVVNAVTAHFRGGEAGPEDLAVPEMRAVPVEGQLRVPERAFRYGDGVVGQYELERVGSGDDLGQESAVRSIDHSVAIAVGPEVIE